VGLACVLAVVCGALASATFQRNAEYASGLSMWQTVVDRWPHGRAFYNLSVELKAAGRRDEALAALRTAVQDYPDARSVLGAELIDRGQIDDGIAELRSFIRDRPSHINVVSAHGRLADALLAQQRYAEASAEYREFLAHRPDAVAGWTNFGIAVAAGGGVGEAVHAFERSVALEPGNANTHRNLANALLDRRDFERAAREAAEAVRLAPQDTVAREILTLAMNGERAAAAPQQSAPSHHADAHPPPSSAVALEIAARPTPLRTGIGAAHDPVGTASTEAQAFYDQGLAYLHSYVWVEAARSFNQALRLDPKLAMAHLGLTIAYTELNAGAAAHGALERAMALAVSDHDRRHVGARALQMAAEDAPRDGAKLAAYRDALDQALATFPSDEELWLQRGQAESPDPAERGQGSVAGSVRFYEKARALAPAHFAAAHYLTHAYENSGRIQEALTQGATYAKMAPGVPHARHMHGHDLRRVGRIDEAIAEFEAADALATKYFAAEQIPVEYDWHYQHNLDLLATSYQYVGQMAKAEARLKASFAIASTLVVQELNKREWPVFLLARGRAREALAAATVLASHRSPVVSAAGHVAAGQARLALGEFKAASDEANTALRLMRASPEGAGLVETPLQALQGEFFLRTGQKARARPMLEEVARKARAAPGPDAWTQALFTLEAIARAAREVGEWALAGWAAHQMLEHDPNYAGTHYALALVAEHNGEARTAEGERALMEKYWSRADAGLAELKRN
jgi:tetratricopeptide (TPR) repeat protein